MPQRRPRTRTGAPRGPRKPSEATTAQNAPSDAPEPSSEQPERLVAADPPLRTGGRAPRPSADLVERYSGIQAGTGLDLKEGRTVASNGPREASEHLQTLMERMDYATSLIGQKGTPAQPVLRALQQAGIHLAWLRDYYQSEVRKGR